MLNSPDEIKLTEATTKQILESNIKYVAECFLAGFTPPPDLTVSQWAEGNRILPKSTTSEHGPWRNSRTPYLVEIMDECSPQSMAEDVAFMKSSQVGGTELLINVGLYYIQHDPAPIGVFEPSEMITQKFMDRFTASAKEMGMDKLFTDSTKYVKTFPGGQFFAGWSSSEAHLRSSPLRIVLGDEVGAWVEDCEGFGDPIKLAEARTDTFARKKRIFCGTPGTGENCRIYSRFKNGDQRVFMVPCPNCGELHELKWENMIWDKDEDGHDLPATARMKCPNCSEFFSESWKDEILAAGQWVATNPAGTYPSFRINALYSPLGWCSWKTVVKKFLEAVRSGSRAMLKAFFNNYLGEIWIEQEEEKIDTDSLFVRKEDYGCEVPDGVIVLTAGVDTQDNRLEVEIRGWGRNFESWGILKKIIVGDPHQDAVWQELDQILLSPYTKANGESMYVACCLQDAMGHCTDEVYKFTAPRESRRVFACKGVGGTGKPMTMLPKKTEKGRKYSASLVDVGVDTIKDQIFAWMKIEQPGSVGYMHFPNYDDYSKDHFSQLTAEKLVSQMRNGTVVYKYVKTQERNEALDLMVYNRAALNLLRIDLNKYADAGKSVNWNPGTPVVTRRQVGRRVVSGGVRL